MVKLVLGLIGTIGAGKDVVSKYLQQKYNFFEIGMGDLVREELAGRDIAENRENLQAISKELTDKFGQAYWAKKVVQRIKNSKCDYVVINGIRRSVDVLTPKKEFGSQFKLLLVDADPQIRFERIKARNRPGDPQTLEAFKKQEAGEYALYGDFDKAVKLADFKLDNSGTLEQTYSQIDKFIKNLLSKTISK
jgi:dephospho-CoA kinase